MVVEGVEEVEVERAGGVKWVGGRVEWNVGWSDWIHKQCRVQKVCGLFACPQ